MEAPRRYEAVLFDALGTLVRLAPPWTLLRSNLRSRHGIEVSEDEAREAMVAEMSYYLEHHVEGRDPESLADLRARCASIVADHLPAARRLTPDELTELLLVSLRFVPYPDAAPALAQLRLLGLRAAVVSNWDCSLGRLLGELGLGGMFDAVVTSADAGARKPAPEIFATALERLQCPPERGIVVGDSLDTDVAGGRAAGIRSVFLDRAASGAETSGIERIFTLENLPELLVGSPIV